ncbi:MAG: hypothetical protein M3R69_11850, partial [Acidobacteriota bacterium]|nr:hypothetical protein [Acidobacteriota bacterium]
PTLRGRVRIWPNEDVRSRGQFAAKAYRLDKSMGVTPPGVEQYLPELEGQFGVRPSASARFTEQEKRTAIFIGSGNIASGFYLPLEDTFYLKPGTNLADPRTRSTARHEMAHLLGGAEQTRSAFRQRYGENYMRYWRPFEEGMAELVKAETQPEAERRAVAAGETSTSGDVTVEIGEHPFYVASQAWIRSLIAAAPGNRQLLLRAYFTGNIPETVFQLIESISPPRLPQ